MAEDVNYSTVVFKTTKTPRCEVKKEEEAVYEDMRGQRETAEQTADTNGLLPDEKSDRHDHHQQLSFVLGILCVILLLGIVGVSVYFDAELKRLKDHQTTLMAVNHNLTTENHQLKARNYNLTEKILDMEAKWNLNVSQAQWTIDSYCPKVNDGRKCKPCQKGWNNLQSSCYAFNNAERSKQLTWEGARENCRGKDSDLAVIVNEEQKSFTPDYSWSGTGINGYWIGLRAENGKWKWIDGSSLTQSSWIQSPPPNNSCVISLQNKQWKSVSCDVKNAWICEKKALSV